jgi:formylglycine-generating enzyme required for sulfatase activity
VVQARPCYSGHRVLGTRMKTRKFCIALPMLAGLLLVAPAFGQSSRYAVVIGNGNYTELGKLKNPVNDARDFGEALKSLGFEVEFLADADLPSMEDAVVRLGNRLAGSKDSIGFFFYAGHGVQSNGINYLVPADAHIASASFLKTKALSAQEMLDVLQEAHNALNVVVLDACRDNPFSWGRSGTRGLSVVAAQPPGSIVAYATSAGSVAQDGAGRNGVFTSELLKNIREPGVDIMEVFKRTGAGVQAATAGAQVPAIYNQYFGSAFLAGFGSSPVAAETEKKLSFKLEKSHGSVTVEAKTGGTLYFNGTAVGQLKPGFRARVDDVDAGQVSVEMRYEDGRAESKTAEVPRDGVTTVSFTYVERSRVLDGMALVKGGTYLMGNGTSEGSDSERPVHAVGLSSFYLGACEVTQREWNDVMGTNPAVVKGDDLPVTWVNWYDVVEYCNRLSARNGFEPCYWISGSYVACDFSKNGFRLPTEAEWEFAAKGGPALSAAKYSGGDLLDAVGWYGGSSPRPVGQKKANELGLFDMSGNVGEWCWDRFGTYSRSSDVNPVGAPFGQERIVRGGSWKEAAGALRTTARMKYAPDSRVESVGFRLALSARGSSNTMVGVPP